MSLSEEKSANRLRYFDDPEQGPAPATSHPRFVALVGDAGFYYSEGDDFSPFGNDDGSDLLSELVDWYQAGTPGTASDWVRGVLQDWNLGVPEGMARADEARLNAWLRQDAMHARYLAAICRAWVAAAFGQLKITGQVDAPVRDEAQAALVGLLTLNQRASEHSPDWPHAALERERLLHMQGVLAQV